MPRGNPQEYVPRANVDMRDPNCTPRSGRPRLPDCVFLAREAVSCADVEDSRLPKKWADVLRDYTRDSRELNLYMVENINCESEDSQETKVLDRWSEKLCKAIRFLAFKFQEGAATLWRVCNLYPRQVNWYIGRKGKLIQWNAFTSCSSKRKVAERFRYCSRFVVIRSRLRAPIYNHTRNIQTRTKP